MLYSSSVWNGIAMRSFWKVWPPYQWCTCSPDCQLERAFLFAFSTFERYIHLKVYAYPSVFVFLIKVSRPSELATKWKQWIYFLIFQ